VQFAKSLMCEIMIAYLIDNDVNNIMIAYSKREVVSDVFDERLKPMVMEMPCIRKYWDGLEDNLTKRRIKLRHITIRVASAQNRADMASHNAGIIYGDEFAKWPAKDFDPLKMLRGRQNASRMLGKKTKAIFATSPINDQDKSYQLCHGKDIILLKPHYPCPHCGVLQTLKLKQIFEVENENGEKDHDPTRIRQENAAIYVCEHCGCIISEDQRFEMQSATVWKSDDECVDSKYNVVNRKKTKKIAIQYGRLIDYTWRFSDCLASYFEAYYNPDITALFTFLNEDMGEWVSILQKKREISFLRSKCKNYYQYGSNAYVPDGVSVILAAIDTQDNGFYYVIRGYGQNMESWLIVHDFITCDMKESYFQNPANVTKRINDEIKRHPLKKRDGKQMSILAGLIDHGGHRKNDVDYFVSHNQTFSAYKGSSHRLMGLVDRKGSGIYHGSKEDLSRIVDKNIESDLWHLPRDVTNEYCQQVINQYDEEYVDARGNKKKRRVDVDPDHYRDCENYLCACTIIMELNKTMFDDKKIRDIENINIDSNEVVKEDSYMDDGFVQSIDNLFR
jgi:phage terminase large subunit GpA-like protein